MSEDEYYENDLASIIVDCCYHIHVNLGPGLLESVYEEILFSELTQIGLKVERQKQLPVIWKNKTLDLGFRTDLIIENKVIIEIKSVTEIHPVHPKQLLTYLKLSGLKLGLLINFNSPLIKTGITRIVNGL
ncbi:GxxExxY protein [Flaviramulus sp. BrNp1-15]|uniref:GxxExxY protein n=1 Tax=Flaviramulus sp. BrNp1-15 TaxID=2916754 RepID=UPI001EE90868|nr:GxxExxY protein [Flaviramulus sp. BrNp1-15]ULC59171.1 GxxExxY protein [Flaviramulus sp. BrNp1-15]